MLDPAFLFMATVMPAVGAGLFWLRRQGELRRARLLEAVARPLGLQRVKSAFYQSPAFEGRVGPRQLAARLEDAREDGALIYRLRVSGLPEGIGVLRRGRLGRLFPPLLDASGDPGFDQELVCEGGPAVVCAFLSQRVRRQLLDFVLGPAGQTRSARSGDLTATGVAGDGPADFVRLGEEMFSLVNHILDATEDVPARVAENAQRDPLASVRKKNLEVFLREFPDSHLRAQVLTSALKDADPDVQLAAARETEGAETDRVLEAVAGHAGMPEASRLDALARRLEGPKSESLLALLEALIKVEAPSLQRPAVRALGKLRGARGLRSIESLTESTDSGVVVDAVWALAQVAGSDAEPRLLELLSHPQRQVQRAVVDALAEVGTPRALEGLAAVDAGFFKNEVLNASIDSAVRNIEARRGVRG